MKIKPYINDEGFVSFGVLDPEIANHANFQLSKLELGKVGRVNGNGYKRWFIHRSPLAC